MCACTDTFFTLSFSDIQVGVYIQTKKGDLLNVAQFNFKSKSVSKVVRELLFADDSALVAHTPNNILTLVDRFATVAQPFSLQINIKKPNVFITRQSF